MQISDVFQVDETRALSETLEGETIIINLATGSYYNMNETGTCVWEGVQAHESVGDIIEACVARFDGDRPSIEAAVFAFLESAVKEGLIALGSASTTIPREPFAGSKKSFVAPRLDVYTDLQQMLLADPIHDVEAEGWPVLKKP